MSAGEAFWAWALAAYDREGVADACLALQDDHGQQTAYLLWAAWAGPDPAMMARGAALARRWEAEALAPIRAARRAMKAGFDHIDDAARLALREEVKAVELGAERLLMVSLAALAAGDGPGADAEARITAAAAAWGDPPPRSAVLRLSEPLA